MEQASVSGVLSVNSQVVGAVIFTGLWMLNVNRKLRKQNDYMREMVEGMKYISYNVGLLHSESVTVKDVIRLAAETSMKENA